MADDVTNLLFLCTGNSARSVMAEAILNREGRGRFRAYSAGSHPAGAVNPHALALLGERGHPIDGLSSKSWDVFAEDGAPVMHFVITVCDNAAGEVCPVWPGRPATAHWPFTDPAACEGPEARAVFDRVYGEIEARIRAFVALPFDTLDEPELHRRIAALGDPGPGAGNDR
jgi:arsenate reductase